MVKLFTSLLKIFKKPRFDDLDAAYRKVDIEQYSWVALAVNQRSLQDSLLTKELVLTGMTEEKTLSWQIAEKAEGHYHLFNVGKSPVFNGLLIEEGPKKMAAHAYNTFINELIEKKLKTFQNELIKSPLSFRQMETEEKALEWMRVSFEVLGKGVVESLTNPDYLFQSTLFCGINPKTQKHEIRLITFNLDMTFIVTENHDLRVMIYNKGPKESFEGAKAALLGDYSARKREMLDQLIQLLGVLSRGFQQ